MMKNIDVVSLFSGAGGLDVGIKQGIGAKFIFANELLSSHAKTYSINMGLPMIDVDEFNKTKKLGNMVVGDIEKVDISGVGKKCDILVGGPPCQDFSVLRGSKWRRGIEVKRGRLYLSFIKFLKEFSPDFFIFENVPGLKSANNGLAYPTILSDLSSPGAVNGGSKGVREYRIIFSGIVDMSALGVPQQRKRLIIVGMKKSSFELDDVHIAEAEIKRMLSGGEYLFREYPLTPIEVFRGETIPNLQDEYKDIMKGYDKISSNPPNDYAKKWVNGVYKKLKFDIIDDYLLMNNSPEDGDLFEMAMKEHKAILKELGYWKKDVGTSEYNDGSNRLPKENESVLKRLSMIPPGGNFKFVERTEYEIKALMSNIYRRINPIQPSPTIIAYGGGGTWGYHYSISRGRLTNRERARLQTFPDWVLFNGKEQEIRAQIEEAIPSLFGIHISKFIKEIILSVSNGKRLDNKKNQKTAP